MEYQWGAMMGRNLYFIFVVLLACLKSTESHAFKNNTFSLGVGYYSENFMGKTSQKPDGSSSLLGEASYPLNIKYDYALSTDWFIAPQLSNTFMPRKSPGNSAKISIMHLFIQIGKNIRSSGSEWDLYAGPGYLTQEIVGAGGTTQLNNGTDTATFAVPGNSSTIRKVTVCAGSSISFDHSRFGLDIMFVNFMSNAKRIQNIMLSYSYQFGGGF